MKKLIFLSLVLSLVFCSSTFADVIFEDDFESYTVGTYPSAGGWYNLTCPTMPGCSALISTDDAYSGTKSFRIQGNNENFRSEAVDISPQDFIIFECAININNEDEQNRIGFLDKGDIREAEFIFDNGVISVGKSGSHVAVGAYTTGTWYKVKGICNFQTQTMDAYINDSLVGSDVPIGDNSWDCFNIGSGFQPTGGAYFDDVKISTYSIPTLTEWGIIIFMTIMMGIGVMILRKRRIA